MAANNQALTVQIKADLSGLQKGLDKATSNLKAFGSKMKSFGSSMSRYVTLPLTAAGGVAVAQAVKFEKLATSLNVLTGSAEAGAVAFERIKKFSAQTPFQLDELVSVNNQLMGFGMNADQAFKSLQMLGDVSSVSGAQLDRVAIAFGQSAAAGRVMTQDLNQFINNGIPIYQLLGDVTGKNVGELRDLASQGGITFDLLNQAFIKATSEGGKFFEGTAKLSQTLGGRLSTLRDNFNLMMGEIGQLIGEALSPLISAATKLFQAFSNLTDNAKRIIVIVGGLVAAIGPLLLGLSAMVKGFIMVKGAILATKGAFIALRTAVITNPMIAIITASVLALATAAVYLWDNWNIVSQHMVNAFKMIKNFAIDFVKVTLRNLSTFVDGLVWLGEKVGIHFENPLKSVLTTLEDSKSVIEPVTGEWGSLAESFTNAAVALGLVKDNAEEATKAVEQAGEVASKVSVSMGGTGKVQLDQRGGLSSGVQSGEHATKKASDEIESYTKNIKAATVATETLQAVTNGTAQSIISSLGMIAGESRGFALFEIAANTAIGLAKAVQAGAGLPFPTNIPAIGAGTAAVLSGIASAKQVLSSAPAFANGGIVNGSSFSGDRVMARVNSGEMILNRSQQANLFGMINRGGGGNERLVTQIAGNDLRIVLERAQKTNQRLR